MLHEGKICRIWKFLWLTNCNQMIKSSSSPRLFSRQCQWFILIAMSQFLIAMATETFCLAPPSNLRKVPVTPKIINLYCHSPSATRIMYWYIILRMFTGINLRRGILRKVIAYITNVHQGFKIMTTIHFRYCKTYCFFTKRNNHSNNTKKAIKLVKYEIIIKWLTPKI